VSSADSLPAFRIWRRALRPPRRVAAQKQGREPTDEGIEPGTGTDPSLFHIDNYVLGYHTFLFDHAVVCRKYFKIKHLPASEQVPTR